MRAVTTIICKLTSTEEDKTIQLLPVHEECMRMKKKEWAEFESTAVLSDGLLRMLLGEWEQNVDFIVQLMLKFGLLVRIIDTESSSAANGSGSSDKFIVPVLLKPAPPSFLPVFDVSNPVVLAFSVDEAFAAKSKLSPQEIVRYGFLPAGFFSRFLGKLVKMCLDTSEKTKIDTLRLHSDAAVLWIGKQDFFIRECLDEKVIKMVVQGISLLLLLFP